MYSGCTQSERFDGRVHGVVVHASINVLGSSSRGKDTITGKKQQGEVTIATGSSG